jgi:hypothetical protein
LRDRDDKAHDLAGTPAARPDAMAKSKQHQESWVVPVLVFEWTVIFCGFMATIVVLMLH